VDDELGKVLGGSDRVLIEVLHGICMKLLSKITKPVYCLFNDVFSAAQFVYSAIGGYSLLVPKLI
jgi:hypothetical protein